MVFSSGCGNNGQNKTIILDSCTFRQCAYGKLRKEWMRRLNPKQISDETYNENRIIFINSTKLNDTTLDI